jgi:hypothetical protein
MQLSWSHDSGHGYEMLTRVNIFFSYIFFYTDFLFQFQLSTLGLLKINFIYFYFIFFL